VFVQEVPKDAERLYDEGVELIAEKSDEQAFEKLRKAIEAFPRYFAALDRLGNEYVLRGHYRPAIILLSEAIKINPKSFSSTFGLGLARFRLNDLELAIANFDRSIELYRDSVQANLWRGISLHAVGKYAEAEKALHVAGKLSKGELPEVHWQLARVYKDQGRLADAVAELELLLKLKPDAADADEIRKTIVLLKEKSKPAS
jgi:tetratricopeptide (TPR) repeat protein